MPRATANIQEVEHIELKSLPEGFIDARRLTYGEKLERRAMVSKMKFASDRKDKDFAGEMNLVNELATVFDFQRCIVDHNLEDEEGVKLNLGRADVIRSLDPRIGEEIDTKLSELNNWDEDDEGN